jgi:WD40 repeat protein
MPGILNLSFVQVRPAILFTLAIWSLVGAPGCKAEAPKKLSSTTPRQVAFSPDGSRVAIAYGDFFLKEKTSHGMVVVLNSKSLARQTHCESVLPVECLGWCRDSRRIAFGTAGALANNKADLRIWDTADESPHLAYTASYSVAALAVFPTTDLIGVGFNAHDQKSTFRVVKMLKETDHAAEAPFRDDVCRIAIDGKESNAALGNYEVIRVFRFPDMTEQATLKGHKRMVVSLAFSEDGGGLVSADMGGVIKEWRWKEQLCSHTVDTSYSKSLCITFFSGGKLAAIGADGMNTIALVDVATGKTRSLLEGHTGRVVSIAVSPDGKRLCSASDKDHSVRLWDIESREQLAVYRAKE